MSETITKAILVVSFGTSYEETRKKTIEAIENDIADAFPTHRIYRAWTSGMIIRKVQMRDHLHVDTVSEALERMAKDGITDIVIQPTHVINGIENDAMKADALAYAGRFASIRFGTPLLTTTEDSFRVIDILASAFSPLTEEEALVFMGHGTAHYVNSVYAALDYMCKDRGYSNIFIGTVEAYPSLETVLNHLRRSRPKKVILAPFMIVAGDHASNDLAGEDSDSWASVFASEGYDVTCVLQGLGEYEGIRRLFLEHVADALSA